MEALKLALSPLQRRFAEEYNLDFNGSAAAIRAGYAPSFSDRQAHILLKHKGVAALIDHLGRSKAAAITSVSPDYVIQQVTAIIGKPDAKDGDRLRGLELIARHLGMFIERTEITGKDGGPLSIEHQKKVEEEAQNFNTLLKGLSKRADSEKQDVTLV
jgi:phage terminase small subunit